jgi:hypothetical protein
MIPHRISASGSTKLEHRVQGIESRISCPSFSV